MRTLAELFAAPWVCTFLPHDWGKWEKKENNITRVGNDTSVIGWITVQHRTCLRCGRYHETRERYQPCL